MAVDRFQLQIEASTRGEQDLARMEAAVNRFSAAAEKSGAKTKSLGTDMAASGDKIRDAFANPMQAAGDAAQSLLGRLGPVGTAIGAVATAAIAAGTAVFGLAKSYADLYDQERNAAVRLGVTTREFVQFSRVAQEAGLQGESVVGMMRGLAKTLGDSEGEGKKASRMLKGLGVDTMDATGNLRPMKQLIFDIAEGLDRIEHPALKADAAMEILGRGGLENLPIMNSALRQQVTELEAAGYGWTQYGERVADATGNAINRSGRKWEMFIRGIKEGASELFLSFADPGWQFDRVRQVPRAGEKGLATIDGEAVQLPGHINPKSLDDRLAAERRRRIAAIAAGGGMQARLAEVKGELSKAIEDNADVEAVRRLSAEYKSLEKAIKAAAEAEKAGTFVARGMKDPYQLPASLYRDGERPMFGGATSTVGVSFGSSLLKPGESVNRGFMGISRADEQARTDRALEAARATADYQSRRVQLMTGPGGEIAAVQTATSIRLAALEQELTLGTSIFEVERQRLQITRDGELQILEIQKARAAETRAAGASIFDAITAGGGGVKNYAAGLGMGTGRTIFSNLYSQVAGGMSGKLSLTSNPNSMIGKILQGTPFGADPNAQAGAVQMTAAQIQMQAAQTQLSAAGMGGAGGGIGSLLGLAGGGSGGSLPSNVAMLNPFYKGGGMSTGAKYTMGIGAGIGAGLGVMSGIQQGGAGGALTSTASLAGGAAALLPMLSKSLALAGPIGGAIAIGATLAMAFLPDPKQARRMALEEQAKQRTYDEASGVEYTSDVYGRSADYGKRGDVRVYLNVNALDAQNIIDRQADIGEAVRQALSSYPPLALDVKGAALGA